MFPHIPISIIANPSSQSFFVILFPHTITHYIKLLSIPFVLLPCNNCLPYLSLSRRRPSKNESICPSVIYETYLNFHIANPSPQSFLINRCPHPITHYIKLLFNPFVLPPCNNCLLYSSSSRPRPSKNELICP